jgi:hypothetical protein
LNRIHADMVGFLLEAFVVAEAVIEEASLRADAGIPGAEAFPCGDQLCEVFFARARNKGVQVIGHEQPKADIPAERVVIVTEGG